MATKQIRFASRLPETFAKATVLKEEAWQRDGWEFLGAIAEAKTLHSIGQALLLMRLTGGNTGS